MKQLRNCILITLLCCLVNLAQAQTPAMVADSTKPMSIHEFFELILANHPVARQAALLSQLARQELRTSGAGFDPYLTSKFFQKELESKNYYTLWESYLTVPTWFGASIKAGYDKDSGYNLSGDDYMGPEGLSYLGISVPLGEGLIMDQRRATLRQAQQLPRLAEADKVKVINKLLLQAGKDYWDWQLSYNKFLQYRLGYDFANVRYKATRERALQGDLSTIDTVEAMIQMQNFEVYTTQSELEFRNASLMLSNYLWKENNTPLELAPNVVPTPNGTELVPVSPAALDTLVSYAILYHPELIKLDVKLKQLDIERRLVANKMLPKLNIDYGLLQKGFYTDPKYGGVNYNTNNYKVGINFSTPIFLREERGKLQMMKLKINDNRYESQRVNREIVTSIHAAYNEWIALERLIRVQESLVYNSELLRNAEQTKFENGESSLFLVNAREQSLISNRIKLYELKAKYAKNKNLLSWCAGKMLK